MIPVWIFILALFVFVGILIWERWEYKKLYNYVETLEYFLDMYITKYGTLPGITKVLDEDINANNAE